MLWHWHQVAVEADSRMFFQQRPLDGDDLVEVGHRRQEAQLTVASIDADQVFFFCRNNGKIFNQNSSNRINSIFCFLSFRSFSINSLKVALWGGKMTHASEFVLSLWWTSHTFRFLNTLVLRLTRLSSYYYVKPSSYYSLKTYGELTNAFLTSIIFQD